MPIDRPLLGCYYDSVELARTTEVNVTRYSGGPAFVAARGASIPRHIEATARDPSWPAQVSLVLEVEDGRVVVDEVTLRRASGPSGTAGITTQSLRSFPLTSIVRQVPKELPLAATLGQDGRSIELLGPGGTVSRIDGVKQSVTPRSQLPRSKALRARELHRIVEAYRAALNDPNIARPRYHVATQLGYSSSYIGKLLNEARRADPPLLGPAPSRGKAGEVAETP